MRLLPPTTPSFLPNGKYGQSCKWGAGAEPEAARAEGLTELQQRIKRLQQKDQAGSAGSGSESDGCLSKQQAGSQSNLSSLKSSMSEVKSTIDEMTQSNSVYSSQAASKIHSSQSKHQQSKVQSSKSQSTSQSNLSSSSCKSNLSSSTSAIKSTKTSSASTSIHSSKSTNALESNFSIGSSNDKLAEFHLADSPRHEFAEGLLPADQFDLNGATHVTQEQSSCSSKKKVTQNNESFESATGSRSQSTSVQAGDLSYRQSERQCASRSKVERGGVTEEREAALTQEARSLTAGGSVSMSEGRERAGVSHRVTGQDFSARKTCTQEQQVRQTVTPSGTVNQAKSRKQSKADIVINTNGVQTMQSTSMSSQQSRRSVFGFEEFTGTVGNLQAADVKKAIIKYSGVMSKFVDKLKDDSCAETTDASDLLDNMNDMIRTAWSVPKYGHEIGFSLCETLKHSGGLDILLENCNSEDNSLKFTSAKVLEQCLTTENRGYVVENGLQDVVNVACDCTQENNTEDQSRVGTGILEHLFKHSETTCSDIIKMGGLEAVVRECRKTDVETLRHCAGALANLSLYGGSENQLEMIQRKVAIWLFPLAFHTDDNIKYYACLAIAALVANTEIEAQVLQADTLSLIDPFVNSHLPERFANSTVAHKHGQSKDWLQKLVHVLNSKREEARNLAAFHFCMEAGIKKNQDNLEIFREIGAIDPLKQVASSPNAIASKWAAHALRLMGEEVPHKLSQQVPLWQSEDVQEWLKQIKFSEFNDAFIASRVDGDMLLTIEEENLHHDIGMTNGLVRRKFIRELKKLKQIADYSSKDPTGLNTYLTQIGPEYAEYTYKMLLASVTLPLIKDLSEDHLEECGVHNSIHRRKITEGVLVNSNQSINDSNPMYKNLDLFISYRRSNGSQLASLLKVHMQLKSFSVFIDVAGLEAGKFDNNLLSSIRQAKHFLLVLTANALDRCVGDDDCKDWVHREIVEALDSNCNIIPICDDFFHFPKPETLPEDMRSICSFNCIKWSHDYQDACVEKLERFICGEGSMRGDPLGSLGRYHSTTMLTQPGTPCSIPRTQPIFQRTASVDSNKSVCSDRD